MAGEERGVMGCDDQGKLLIRQLGPRRDLRQEGGHAARVQQG